jgi:glycosyltransferase involved in cell wall biosynthesis
MASARKLLVLDASYAWEAIRARGLEHSVTCRDLDGFFDHVWTVHPFASLVEQETVKFGRPETHSPAPTHTFINGKIGRFDRLRRFPTLNFLVGQTGIFVQLTSLIRKEKISVIRVGDPYNGLLGLGLARLCGVPLVIRVGANYDEVYALTGKGMMPRLFPWRPLEKAVFGFVLSRADLVAAVNDDNLKFAIANGARPDHSTVFRYGNLIDKRHLTPPSTRALDQSVLSELWGTPHRFLLTIGRLEKLKLPDDVLRVHAEVRKRGHDVKLVMVGDGAMREALGALARELGTHDHVVFAGNRDQGWLSRVIPLASAVVSPCTGRALTEVAFGAAPIVGYDLDWQGELITTGETGELVPAGDWGKLADGVERFLTDAGYARAMGDAVRKRAFEILDPAALNQHERDQYAALLRRFERNRDGRNPTLGSS